MKILYLLYVFPALSETFILNEITKLIDLGHEVYVATLFDMMDGKIHDKVKEYGLLGRCSYLKHDSSFHPKGCRRRYSQSEISEKANHKLQNNEILNKKDTSKLLEVCYDNDKDKSLRLFLDCLDLIELIRNKKIEHIHCHFAKENAKMAYVVNQAIGIPYTFITHATDIFVNPNKDIIKWAENAKKVITVSNYNKKYMNEKLGIFLDKIEIIGASVGLDDIVPVKEYKTSPFKIISISRLTEKKGYPYLIKACKILKERGVEFSCEIEGDGPQREELKKLIKENNLEKEIKLGKALEYKEVLKFISTGSVFVLPCIEASNNDFDAIPSVLKESMAMEIPTISTKVTGIPELIDNGIDGILVPQKDAEALAEAIMKVRNDKEFAEKIRNEGREKIEEKFDVEKNIRKLIGVFKE